MFPEWMLVRADSLTGHIQMKETAHETLKYKTFPIKVLELNGKLYYIHQVFGFRKGKPVVRRGRKVMGLCVRVQIARPPKA